MRRIWTAASCLHTPLKRSLLEPNRYHASHSILSQTRALSTSKSLFRHAEPTIYALSTAPGRAAIAIIRVSGPACSEIYHALCPNKALPRPRHAVVRTLYDPLAVANGRSAVLDSNALVLFFPAPRTATGESVLELHVHGGPAVVKAVLSAVDKCNNTSRPIRYAEPGEFTRRAFLNDRLSLPQIESLGDTLSAVTEEQRRLSVQGTLSGLAERYESWRKLLLLARGELEALIDFSEDQHFDESPAELASNVAIQVRALAEKISFHRSNASRGELLRNGIKVSLVGAPNVGKSSLLNLIVGRNAAIVSHEAGTTRDVVEVGVDLGGFFCRLGDTAGLRHQGRADPSRTLAAVIGDIEREGIRRAKKRALDSDVVLLMFSVEPSIQGQGAVISFEQEVLEIARELSEQGKALLVIVNKIDRYGEAKSVVTGDVLRAVQTALPATGRDHIRCISCREAESASTAQDGPSDADPGGLQHLLSGLINSFRQMTTVLTPNFEDSDQDPSQWEESLGATQRQGALLAECQSYLGSFVELVGSTREHGNDDVDIVMGAEILRNAAECLGKITGKGESGDVEEVLGVVFEKFCVGK